MAVISIDAMGGDHGCRTTVAAAVNALRANPEMSFVLVGDETQLASELNRCGWQADSRLEIKHTSETVAMDDPPAQALRSKKDSSMRVAIDLVKSGRVQACVSAGNTGALMAMARFVLRTLPGIDRPAIVSPLPSQSGETLVLDLGANIDSSAENLFQFALMGSALSTALFGIQSPKVGLLNVGVEEIKGGDIVKQAAALVAASELNYVGFVEGNDIFLGDVDVVACDGFVGNIALKSSEGLARLLMGFLRSGFERNFLSKIAGFIAGPVLRRLKSDLDPRHYNGASFLGLNGIVVKSHGDTDVLGFEHAIHTAWLEIQNRVPEQISFLLQSRESENKVQEG